MLAAPSNITLPKCVLIDCCYLLDDVYQRVLLARGRDTESAAVSHAGKTLNLLSLSGITCETTRTRCSLLLQL